MLNQLLEEGPRKLPMLQARKVPPPVTGIIAKCLSVEKRDRHNDAQDLFSHIDEVFEELEKGSSAEAQGAAGAKPFKSWSVSEVCEFVRSIGSAFADKAAAIEENGVDGDFFLKMLDSNDEDLTTSIADGGLGFAKLQLKNVRAKIEERK